MYQIRPLRSLHQKCSWCLPCWWFSFFLSRTAVWFPFLMSLVNLIFFWKRLVNHQDRDSIKLILRLYWHKLSSIFIAWSDFTLATFFFASFSDNEVQYGLELTIVFSPNFASNNRSFFSVSGYMKAFKWMYSEKIKDNNKLPTFSARIHVWQRVHPNSHSVSDSKQMKTLLSSDRSLKMDNLVLVK